VDVDIESIVNAVEFHRFAGGRVDDARVPEYCCWMTADRISAIECPDFGWTLHANQNCAGQSETARHPFEPIHR
jgi:hypothetical protein